MEPNRSNDYQLPSWPPTALNRDLWNTVLLDVSLRLTARENLEATFEELIAQGTQSSLDYIQVSIGPQLGALQAAIEDAQERIEEIIVDGTAPNSAKLGGQLPAFYATAQALIDGLALKVDDADFVARTRAVVAELTGNAPEALDTIYELAAAIGNDPNIRQTLLNAIALKVDKANPQMSGIATIGGDRPTLLFSPTSANKWVFDAFTDNTFRLVDMTAVLEVAKFSTSGAFWTKQLGDVKTYIDTKATAAQTAAIAYADAMPKGIGSGQTWKDVAASRAVNTAYQNTTGRTIAISFNIVGSNTWGLFDVSPDNANWVTIGGRLDTSASSNIHIMTGVEIPAGHYYRFRGSGTFTKNLWVELS